MTRTTPSGVERTFGRDEIIVTKTDLQGRITYANEVFCRVSAFDEADVLGKPHNIIRHPSMPAGVFKLLWDRLRAGQELFTYVVNMAGDGGHYWVFSYVTPTFDARGSIIGYHSNRRVPSRSALIVIEPLYREIRSHDDGQPRRRLARDRERRRVHLLGRRTDQAPRPQRADRGGPGRDRRPRVRRRRLRGQVARRDHREVDGGHHQPGPGDDRRLRPQHQRDPVGPRHGARHVADGRRPALRRRRATPRCRTGATVSTPASARAWPRWPRCSAPRSGPSSTSCAAPEAAPPGLDGHRSRALRSATGARPVRRAEIDECDDCCTPARACPDQVWSRRYRPKCGTVKAMSPRSPE